MISFKRPFCTGLYSLITSSPGFISPAHQLAKVDNLKRRMEVARHSRKHCDLKFLVLRFSCLSNGSLCLLGRKDVSAVKHDASGLTQLSSTVEDVFANGGDLLHSAETLTWDIAWLLLRMYIFFDILKRNYYTSVLLDFFVNSYNFYVKLVSKG